MHTKFHEHQSVGSNLLVGQQTSYGLITVITLHQVSVEQSHCAHKTLPLSYNRLEQKQSFRQPYLLQELAGHTK